MTTISDLFPLPSSPPTSPLLPRRWPGISPESTTALREVLQDNHVKWHIFFNDIDSKSHIAHRALAYWALGAPAEMIKAGYKTDSSYQRPAFDSPGEVTLANFKEHLGDRRYYGAYLAFFTKAIKDQGFAPVVEQFVFSREYNVVGDAPTGDKPEMFNRHLGGLVHPLIHLGYGLEFKLPGIVAEGLAETAVHDVESSPHIPEDFFEYPSHIDETISKFKTLLSPAHTSASTTNVFTILARVLADPELGKVQNTDSGMFVYTMTHHLDALIQHMKDWTVDGTDEKDVEKKVGELGWMNVALYAIGGFNGGREEGGFNADFFHMHLVTSSLFLGTYMSYLKPSSKEHLLRGYLLTSLGWWVSRGRPNIDIKAFYDSDLVTAHPLPTGALPTPSKDALAPPTEDSNKTVTPNAWLPLIETSIVHPDDHLPKIIRALAHYSTRYGELDAKDVTNKFGFEGLEGVERLDGTLFVRAAGLTFKRLGRVREGEKAGSWDRNGFYAKTKLAQSA
ncbi:hypothetical protein H0H92_007516 [Tricholoma furcatifolium]|nr:hypothetical protein H0H92_007516 [Tricholoma furcatifolium]